MARLGDGEGDEELDDWMRGGERRKREEGEGRYM